MTSSLSRRSSLSAAATLLLGALLVSPPPLRGQEKPEKPEEKKPEEKKPEEKKPEQTPPAPPPLKPDLRALMVAPARVPLHEGARAGDYLERVTVRGKLELHERTTIAARKGEGWLVDRSSPAWQGRALRLEVAADGRVLAATAGTPGSADLVPVRLAAERSELPEGEATLETALGKVKARRLVTRTPGLLAETLTRFIATEGDWKDQEVRREVERAGHRMVTVLVRREESSLVVAGAALPCAHLVRERSQEGIALPGIEEWVARTPVAFGETLLRRKEGDVLDEIRALGHDGAPLFPLPSGPGTTPAR